MSIIKCKMCGGELSYTADSTVCECEYCGSKQTVPNADNEKKVNLYNRANRLRMNNEFDKASAVYESIVAEFPEEAEAYWGLCLCAYGIEYVDDPATGSKIPTCHRTLPTSIMEDPNFEQACDNADGIARRVYRDEAKSIDRIQRDILSIASKETPYDVFICYKETDENDSRTQDSVLAQEIYDALTAKNMKVFFSRITLEDKLGTQYEPYIYAALSSAKVMLAIGTDFEYYDAVWVKNEWSRFLGMMKTDKSKALIPCFKDIDAYDMPKEFKGLQAQNMAKLGWLQDLVRGVEKLCGKRQTAAQPQSTSKSNSTVENLMKRANLYLEDGDFDSADAYFEKVLDIDAEYAPAYIGKLCVELKLESENKLILQSPEFSKKAMWSKALRFADENQKELYNSYLEQAKDRVIYFGTYPQTESGDDETPIEWLVLDRQDDKLLLLSRYGLDVEPYNEEYEDITWGNCTLRAWLNETFINDAFSLEQQQCILLTDVDNSRSQGYSGGDTTDGNNTQNKIFLLSYEEAHKYLDVSYDYDNDNNTKSRVAPTDYAIAQGAWQDNDEGDNNQTEDDLYAGCWWLRSSGCIQIYAECVGSGGSLIHIVDGDDDGICVRPALWIRFADENQKKLYNYDSCLEQAIIRQDEEWERQEEEEERKRQEEEERKRQEEEERKRQEEEERKRQEEEERKQKEKYYTLASEAFNRGKLQIASYLFTMCADFRDSAEQKEKCIQDYLEIQKAAINKELQESLKIECESLQDEIEEYRHSLDNLENETAKNRKEKSDLEAELAQTRGLFSGRKKNELQQQINSVNERILRNEETQRRLNAMLASKRTELERKQTKASKEKELTEEEVSEFRSRVDGHAIYFGTYPQTKSGNDKTPIEWLLLDAQDDKLLLLSRYGLDAQPYNTEDVRTTWWENCTLRTWLNETFINDAFSSAEQQCILLTDVDNSRSQCYSWWYTTGGNNTQDKIFLLSYAEANKYLDVTRDNSNNIKSRVAPTDYAIAQVAQQYRRDDYKTEDGLHAGWWWLRSPGHNQFNAAFVVSYGSLNDIFVRADNCVRPALWINLDS